MSAWRGKNNTRAAISRHSLMQCEYLENEMADNGWLLGSGQVGRDLPGRCLAVRAFGALALTSRSEIAIHLLGRPGEAAWKRICFQALLHLGVCPRIRAALIK